MRPSRSSEQYGAGAPGAPATAAELQRRREGLIILCTAVAVLLFAFFETRLPQFSGGNSLSNNVIFFLLINLNIILLVLLVFLVARNLTKLVFERRRRMLGSHMRTRLVLAFLAVSIFPAVLIFLVALGFMTSSIENWFNVQVENSLAGSLEIARAYYAHSSENALHHARELAAHVARERLVGGDADERLAEFVSAKQREYDVGTVEVYSADRQRRAVALAEEVPPQVTLGRTSSLLTAALEGRSETRIQSIGDGDVIRAAVPIAGPDGVAGVVVVDYFVPQSVANRSAEIARSFQEYRQLKILKQPITNNYVVTLILVTLLVIFCATWMGFYLAKGITVPIQKLAEGTREVAQGNWQYRIGLGDGTSIAADDEFGSLVGSFNQMTADLETINFELERRRRYMETILATMTGGVISLDQEGRVTTINEAAERLLGLDGRTALGRDVAEVFARPDLNTARELMQELHENAARATHGARAHRQLKLVAGGRVLTIVLTATLLRDDAGQAIGAVLFFEDVTEIVKVQRMEAWREVARRIAHEIKNPLTPIQLSAQRLHKRYADQLKCDGTLFEECTRTIVTQVEELKTLVNEFATFARLPSGEHTPEDLNALVEEAMLLFKEGHRDIRFSFDPDPALPLLALDREGIKRAVINMLDNAVAACAAPNGAEPRIDVRTRYHRAPGIVALEVADTGCGIDPNARTRLFEPYFSTKQGGTGLGLAIVSTIVADHQGFVRVKDNEPRGSRFVIELPVKGQVEQIVLH
ncbi:MAG: PAS domain S-box protein [Deltaproteobacteria bacterium]|nr:PAS domain S-box protein [Deltaproteobacteria bacterium]